MGTATVGAHAVNGRQRPAPADCGDVLILNAGSSSLKFALYAGDRHPAANTLIWRGYCAGIGGAARFVVRGADGGMLAERALAPAADHAQALAAMLEWVGATGHALGMAGHRVVHGGSQHTAPLWLDAQALADLRAQIPLAPLHQPHALAAIDALSALHPRLPQLACFDTAFHASQPPVATAFALPRALTAEGVRRYGFHGLSCEYIASVLPDFLGAQATNGRVIVAHLGAGASLSALRQRRSVATTMGFTALDGLVMGRRCGNLDPGVVLYLLQHKGMSAAQVADLLHQHSGLLGVSGISDDMRELLASADPHAREAIDLFVYRIGREIGSLAAALGGLDALVFTAGIGEHAAEIRRRVCEQAAWLGLGLDEAANTAGGPCISSADAAVSAWVIPTDEDLVIARHAWDLRQSPNYRTQR
ncbi:MAG: acetate/propionate family kinase [Proteobacteria bacterium]|nr:acetate/propionate family kinase [Pseudomonadota bacterium]